MDLTTRQHRNKPVFDLSYMEEESARDAELERAFLSETPFDQLLTDFITADAEALKNGKWNARQESARPDDAGPHGGEVSTRAETTGPMAEHGT